MKWHDGKPLTADDAVYTFNRVSAPDAKPATPTNVNWIEGAEKTGDLSFRLKLKQPFPVALEYLSSLLPVMPDQLYGADGSKTPTVEDMVGTGPYKITAFTPSSTMSVERTGEYFADSPKAQPEIETVKYTVIPDNTTQIAALLSGEADWIWNVPPDQAQALKARPELSVESVETMRESFITFMAREEGDPLADKRVRQAIAYAIDRQKIIDSMVGEGSSIPAAACYRTQFGCAQDVTQYGYDPEKAKALLEEAGYSDGLTLDIQAFRSSDWTAAVASYLNKVGIDTTINYIGYPAAQERLSNGSMNLYLQDNGWLSINDTAAPLNYYFSGNDYDSIRDEELTGWVKQAAASTDPAEREDLYRKALTKIADEMYWLPMWTHPNIYAFKSELDVPLFTDENPRFYFASWK